MPKKSREEKELSKEPLLPGEGEVICGITRFLGANYLLARCSDGEERKIRIPGKMRRKEWLREGDIVLVSLWDVDPRRGDVVYRYSSDDVEKLLEMKIITKEFLEALSGAF